MSLYRVTVTKRRDPWAALSKLLFLFFIPPFERSNKVFHVFVHKLRMRVTLAAYSAVLQNAWRHELVRANDCPFWTSLFSPLFTARGPNEQVKVSAGLRAVQNEQPNERQCSVQTPFRGLNTERAERTGDNIGRKRVRGQVSMIVSIFIPTDSPYLIS